MSDAKALPWDLPPMDIRHDPTLDQTFVDPFAKFATDVKIEVSPEQFDTMKNVLVKAESDGHGPVAAASLACEAVGIRPPEPFTCVAVVVNPLLVRDSVTGLWPGQKERGDIPAFLKRG